jgi:hypothetical protein
MKTKVQLSNGHCMTIEGANAERVAEIVMNNMTINAPLAGALTANADDSVNEMPVMNFGKQAAQATPEDDNEPLEMPSTLLNRV